MWKMEWWQGSFRSKSKDKRKIAYFSLHFSSPLWNTRKDNEFFAMLYCNREIKGMHESPVIVGITHWALQHFNSRDIPTILSISSPLLHLLDQSGSISVSVSLWFSPLLFLTSQIFNAQHIHITIVITTCVQVLNTGVLAWYTRCNHPPELSSDWVQGVYWGQERCWNLWIGALQLVPEGFLRTLSKARPMP